MVLIITAGECLAVMSGFIAVFWRKRLAI
ncbi:hypothetical protein WH7805_00010 [Synechococcus sp. WH 7805]|nr:hypothetical protein WH7805_00010 [Synechococcus sp. WH 7805]